MTTTRRTVRINLQARAASAERRRVQTRDRLLDAAEAVVGQKGMEAAKIDEFVRAAGVSRGTFYNYFPTATDLLHALNTRAAAAIDSQLAVAGARIEDPARRLAASLHTVMNAYSSDPVRGWVALHLAASRAPRQAVYEARFNETFREGVSCGRFRPVDIRAAWTLAFGTIRMAQRDMMAGTAIPADGVQIVALVLTAFGLPLAEAEAISRDEAAVVQAP